MTQRLVNAFVAYPSKPLALVEAIEQACELISSGGVVSAKPWRSLTRSGRIIMSHMCQEIATRELFICDLTQLNSNVLFELGYAIAANKNVWVLVNTGVAKAAVTYRAFRVLTSISYASYANSYEIKSKFYNERPDLHLRETVYQDLKRMMAKRRDRETILYLKSPIETNESITLSRAIASSVLDPIVDDPSEVPDQPLAWYMQELVNAYAVVVHLLSKDQNGWRLHNAKASLVAGMAHSLGKHLLILAHSSFDPVIDYAELMFVHETSKSCKNRADAWLETVEHDYKQLERAAREARSERRTRTELQSLSIGDPMAENESESLVQYFVPTATYSEVLNAQEATIVGRIGTGKTAVLLRAADELASSRHNHVCVIQPGRYEWEGLVELISEIGRISEQGYVIESLWKFLIYTELSKSLYGELTNRKGHYLAAHELGFLRFVEEKRSLLLGDFTLRLEEAVERLSNIDRGAPLTNQRIRTSELLHETLLRDLRGHLGTCLAGRERVAILIDNLDKGWTKTAHLEVLSKLLLGLIGMSHQLWTEFRKQDHWRRSVKVSLALFLRADIFAEIVRIAPESHKISPILLSWDDQDTLLQVLERRIEAGCRKRMSRKALWDKFFCSSVGRMPVKEYLVTMTLPRPRDLIFLCKSAIIHAQNRGHTRVEEEDLISAQEQYSRFAFSQLVAEGSTEFRNFENLLTCFLGVTPVVPQPDVMKAFESHGLGLEDVQRLMRLLITLGFLGVEGKRGRYVYSFGTDLVSPLGSTGNNRSTSYRINDPFHSHLEIE